MLPTSVAKSIAKSEHVSVTRKRMHPETYWVVAVMLRAISNQRARRFGGTSEFVDLLLKSLAPWTLLEAI
jgi:hypothetical protein